MNVEQAEAHLRDRKEDLENCRRFMNMFTSLLPIPEDVLQNLHQVINSTAKAQDQAMFASIYLELLKFGKDKPSEFVAYLEEQVLSGSRKKEAGGEAEA